MLGRFGHAVLAVPNFVSPVNEIQFLAYFTEPHQARPEFRDSAASCFMDYRQQTQRKSHVSTPTPSQKKSPM